MINHFSYSLVENIFANMMNQGGVNQGAQVPLNANVAGPSATTGSTTSSTQNQVPISQPFPFGLGSPVPPPFPFMAPFTMPPPPMPPNLSTLTDEELRALEGTERQNVENRIKVNLLKLIMYVNNYLTLYLCTASSKRSVDVRCGISFNESIRFYSTSHCYPAADHNFRFIFDD